MFKPCNSDCRDFDIISWQGRLWMIYIRSSATIDDTNDFGLASSSDGFNWQDEGIIMRPSESGWDCKSLWAMHLVREANGFVLYYSALGLGSRRHQSIGIAHSSDLRNWSRESSALLTLSPDNSIYSDEIDKIDKWYPDEPAILFRDPWTFFSNNKKYLIFAAKDRAVNHQNNACVGLAELREDNSIKYCSPIFSSEKYHIIECPALYQINKKWFLIFCDDIKNEIRYAVSDNPFYGFREPTAKPLMPKGNYVGRIVEWNNEYLFFYNTSDDCLADPKHLAVKDDKIILR
jgi:sucrose-6-phosphate hydrolase SacC (GH32 family)